MQILPSLALLLFFVTPMLAEKAAPKPLNAPPEITPPSASPGATAATPVPRPIATPTATPAQKEAEAPTLRTLIDSLPPGEVQDAINFLKSNYLKPTALSEQELNRATLAGLLGRLTPGASISLSAQPANEIAGPFRREIIDNQIGYLRVGALTKNDVIGLDAALQNFTSKQIKSVILDLRATSPSSDFELATEVIKMFSPRGRTVFSLRKPGAKERIFISTTDPKFQGVLVVVVDQETAGAAEVIAAALRAEAKALIVGSPTKGAAAEYGELNLHSGKTIRVAVAEVVLPQSSSLFLNGVKPDLQVEMAEPTRREVLQQSLEKGVTQFIFETERPRMNEAALVAGTNPELDAIQVAQRNRGERPQPPLHDTVLQRAVDLITTIGIYEAKPPPEEN
jgi:hypothetical protein